MYGGTGERIPGDPGCPGTFPFPVLYETVEGSYRDLIQGSRTACHRLCQAAKSLAEQGASAIIGDCGLMALYQRELVDATHLPTVSSSLMLIPLIRNLIAPNSQVGILTGHSELLKSYHLRGAGIEDFQRIAIWGMEKESHFRQSVLEGNIPQNADLMRQDVLHALESLKKSYPRIGAVLLECSNLSSYGGDIAQIYSVPVFDINTAIDLLYHSVCKDTFL